MTIPHHRPRRMRRTPALRALVRETSLEPRHLIAPLFVKEDIAEPAPISSLPIIRPKRSRFVRSMPSIKQARCLKRSA